MHLRFFAEELRARGAKGGAEKELHFPRLPFAFIPVHGSRRDLRDRPMSSASFIHGAFPRTKAGGETIE